MIGEQACAALTQYPTHKKRGSSIEYTLYLIPDPQPQHSKLRLRGQVPSTNSHGYTGYLASSLFVHMYLLLLLYKQVGKFSGKSLQYPE